MPGLFQLTDLAGDQTLDYTVQTRTAVLALHCWGFVLIEICFLHLVFDKVQCCLICHLKKKKQEQKLNNKTNKKTQPNPRKKPKPPIF